MLVSRVEVPHICAQFTDSPCVESCLFDAPSVNEKTSAVAVNREKCTACGA